MQPKRLGINQSPNKPNNLARRLSGGNVRNRLQNVGNRRTSLPNRQSPRVFTNSKLGFNRARTATGGRPGQPQNKPFNRMNVNKANNPQPIKKSLDMDLDEYMSKSKSHLDADLNSYMAKSKSNLDADLDTYMAQAPQ